MVVPLSKNSLSPFYFVHGGLCHITSSPFLHVTFCKIHQFGFRSAYIYIYILSIVATWLNYRGAELKIEQSPQPPYPRGRDQFSTSETAVGNQFQGNYSLARVNPFRYDQWQRNSGHFKIELPRAAWRYKSSDRRGIPWDAQSTILALYARGHKRATRVRAWIYLAVCLGQVSTADR